MEYGYVTLAMMAASGIWLASREYIITKRADRQRKVNRMGAPRHGQEIADKAGQLKHLTGALVDVGMEELLARPAAQGKKGLQLDDIELAVIKALNDSTEFPEFVKHLSGKFDLNQSDEGTLAMAMAEAVAVGWKLHNAVVETPKLDWLDGRLKPAPVISKPKMSAT